MEIRTRFGASIPSTATSGELRMTSMVVVLHSLPGGNFMGYRGLGCFAHQILRNHSGLRAI